MSKKLTKEEFLEKLKTDRDFNNRYGRKHITEGKMVLPPCHYGFQVYTRELSLEERRKLYLDKWSEKWGKATVQFSVEDMDSQNIPTRAISLMWNQRSVDTFLGLPFNIASYGLLLEIIAKEVNMVPDQLIGNLGDIHLYSNHIEQAREQIGRDYTCDERINIASTDVNFDPFDFGVGIEASDESIHKVCDLYNVSKRTRQPFPLPTFDCPAIDEIPHTTFDELVFKLQPEDFYMDDYQSHPTIKAPLSN